MRVIVAEDATLLRAGLVRLLEDAGFEVVAQHADAEKLLESVAAQQPDVVIVDIRMPPTHTTEGLGPRWRSRTPTPTWVCWCCRNTSSPGWS